MEYFDAVFIMIVFEAVNILFCFKPQHIGWSPIIFSNTEITIRFPYDPAYKSKDYFIYTICVMFSTSHYSFKVLFELLDIIYCYCIVLFRC